MFTNLKWLELIGLRNEIQLDLDFYDLCFFNRRLSDERINEFKNKKKECEFKLKEIRKAIIDYKM